MWAGAAEKQAWCPSTFQLLAERLWTAGGHNYTSWMVSLLGTSLHLLRWEGIVSSCSHLRCFLHVPVLAPVRRGVMRWPQARGGLGQALAETVTIRTRKQNADGRSPSCAQGSPSSAGLNVTLQNTFSHHGRRQRDCARSCSVPSSREGQALG